MEKRLNRDFYVEDLELITNEVFYNGEYKTLYAYIDRETNEVVVSTERKRGKSMLHLITITKTKADRYTKKMLANDTSALLKGIKKNENNKVVCKTRLMNEYGKGISKGLFNELKEKAFMFYLDNPHYKCASPMEIYDADVFEWHLAKATKTRKTA